MKRQGRVLIVDDLAKWREQLVDVLTANEFYAASESTAAQTLQRVEGELFHILVLDIRMDDADPTNIDGHRILQDLKQRGWDKAVKVIMLSAYGTSEQMRTAFKDHDVADFRSKDDFNNPAFLEAIQQVFDHELEMNLALDIKWQQGSGPEQLLPLGEKEQMAIELDDLLCRLFHNAQSIVVKPLIPGRSGAGVLLVRPFYAATGAGRALVVKYGSLHKIIDEHHKFEQYVEPFVGGNRATTVLGIRCTPHLGGIIYSQLGAVGEHVESFRQFYQRSSVSIIRDVLDRLFQHTCGSWYANAGQLCPCDLTEEYQRMSGYTHEALEQCLAQLKSVYGDERFFFTELTSARNFANPLRAVAGMQFVRMTYKCVTHGDFNPDNILVDETGNCWLIDFQGTGPSHILRDVAMLDCVVRFQLLTTGEATLDERLAMEDALCSIDRFSLLERLADRFPTHNIALQKAYATVVHLRRIARHLVERNLEASIDEYYIALLYTALNTLSFFSLGELQREHALLSASLLTERLKWSENNLI